MPCSSLYKSQQRRADEKLRTDAIELEVLEDLEDLVDLGNLVELRDLGNLVELVELVELIVLVTLLELVELIERTDRTYPARDVSLGSDNICFDSFHCRGLNLAKV